MINRWHGDMVLRIRCHVHGLISLSSDIFRIMDLLQGYESDTSARDDVGSQE